MSKYRIIEKDNYFRVEVEEHYGIFNANTKWVDIRPLLPSFASAYIAEEYINSLHEKSKVVKIIEIQDD